jgi:fructose-bisphosphate aldolase class I
VSAPATLESTAQTLLAAGKGILAADESFPTIGKRFKALDIPSTEESRRTYREMLFATPGLSDFISGVILFDETIRQQTTAGIPMPEMLAKQGIIPGVKVDKGTVALPNFAGEKFTQGLDGLHERLCEYRELGARFTKWRAVQGSNLRLLACEASYLFI